MSFTLKPSHLVVIGRLENCAQVLEVSNFVKKKKKKKRKWNSEEGFEGEYVPLDPLDWRSKTAM